MATVTVVTAERTLEIEATSIVSGDVNDAGHLILTRHDGETIDVGAVSGMQLDNGTVYSKVDAFTYVGDTDPGAVPNGSVWLDTNDVAGPFASDTQKGLVELATGAETVAATDNTRAVTPAGLAAIPGNKVQILAANANTETALPAAYPPGPSLMVLTTSSGWSLNSGFGSVLTLNTATDRMVQIFFSNPGGTGTPRTWIRQYHPTNNGGGWTTWSQYNTLTTLTAANFAQTTNAFSGYPAGWSRLYYTTANSTNWDFSGMAGEVLTYTEGSDFAKQTFTQHVGGSSVKPVQWYRTANAASGWSAWSNILTDQGAWTAYTPTWTTQSGANTPSFGNAVVDCRYTKIGRTVTVRFEITFGSTTNFGAAPTGSDNWQFSLPVAAARTGDTIGFVDMYQSATNAGVGRAKLYSASGFRISITAGSTAAIGSDADSTQPFTWANGNRFNGLFTYESAA